MTTPRSEQPATLGDLDILESRIKGEMHTGFANLRGEMHEGFAAIHRTLAVLIARTEPLVTIQENGGVADEVDEESERRRDPLWVDTSGPTIRRMTDTPEP